jgi:hypothetical protein
MQDKASLIRGHGSYPSKPFKAIRFPFAVQSSLHMLNERGMFLIMTMWLELLCSIAANAFSVQPPSPVKGVAFYG